MGVDITAVVCIGVALRKEDFFLVETEKVPPSRNCDHPLDKPEASFCSVCGKEAWSKERTYEQLTIRPSWKAHLTNYSLNEIFSTGESGLYETEFEDLDLEVRAGADGEWLVGRMLFTSDAKRGEAPDRESYTTEEVLELIPKVKQELEQVGVEKAPRLLFRYNFH